ncbi:uncharacterized protein JCM15063_003850 [Sporobolomyces koalae]|uniref:uncharacterized protein n=1 Tax=Sporobolomyces koalae TaxID=500713 RepID=UPI00317C4A2B
MAESPPVSAKGPVRSFDPFAPLPSASSPATFSAFGVPASLPRPHTQQFHQPRDVSNSDPFASTSSPSAPAAQAPSSTRAPRPSSLYIPMDDEKRVGNASGNTPTWPFDANAPSTSSSSDGDYLRPSRPSISANTPASPSDIHPSYAEHAQYPNVVSSAAHLPSAEPLNLYSSISIESGPATEAAFSSSAYPGYSRNTTLHASKGSMLGSRPLTGETPSRHGPAYSVGTHGLLSSRQQTNASLIPSSLAQRLDTPAAWLVLYFAFNLGLTLFNKLVLQGFPFPWTLTAIQMLSGTIGTQIALSRGMFTQARLTNKENMVMLAFSGLYTINIAVSNLSLHLVSVPFHQVVRAMTPLFTMALSIVLYRKRYSRQTYLSLVPVICGVAFATFGDYSATAWGFCLTLFGAVLAAFKTIITNRVQVGRLKLHPLDLLVRMSPLAFMQCVFFGWWSGELERVRIYGATEMTQQKATALLVNGAIAFGLNVVSFTANKKTSALTMTVAANVKQVLSIVLAVLIFNLALNPTNLLGIVLTLFGGAWYAKVELQEKQARAQLAANSPSLPGAKLG